MQLLLEEALRGWNATSEEDPDGLVIEAQLREINNMGQIFIEFSPQAVLIPNDWERLWDLSEREKLSLKDREDFEEELKKIMHVTFEQNSDELP